MVKTDDPRTYRHFTSLTEAEEAAWGEVLELDIWGPLGKPRDADAVRFAMQALAEKHGVRWPGLEKAARPRKGSKK